MKKILFLLLVVFIVGCTPAETTQDDVKEVPKVEDPVDAGDSMEEPAAPVEEPMKESEVPAAPPEKQETVQEVHDNKLREGYVDLENFKGTAEDILFAYLDKLDDEEYAKTNQRKYMKMDKKYEGMVEIYFPQWKELDSDFLTSEAEMVGNVWAQANEGRVQYFEAIFHDYRGVKVAKTVVKKGEVLVEIIENKPKVTIAT